MSYVFKVTEKVFQRLKEQKDELRIQGNRGSVSAIKRTER